jgi:hypothetical protein
MHKSPFSLRGLLIGVVLSLAIGLLAPYGIVFNYYWIGFNPSSPGALFFFFVLTFIVNTIVGLISRHFELSKADLVLIYCMLLMAVTVPTWGLMFFLIGTLVYPFYYATPENNYAELFYDSIPTWMVPQDFQAIKDYYEGLPQGAAIPWSVWLEPMGYWLALIYSDKLYADLYECHPTPPMVHPRASDLPDGPTATEHDRERLRPGRTHRPFL